MIVGLVLGLPVAYGGGALSESLLFAMTGSDVAPYLVAIAALILAAICATCGFLLAAPLWSIQLSP